MNIIKTILYCIHLGGHPRRVYSGLCSNRQHNTVLSDYFRANPSPGKGAISPQVPP